MKNDNQNKIILYISFIKFIAVSIHIIIISSLIGITDTVCRLIGTPLPIDYNI